MQRTGEAANAADRTGIMGCPLGNDACQYDANTRRHRHVAHDLNQLGERCSCGANSWLIRFGGPLPAMVCCGLCGQGFNISQRLRDCGKQLVRRYVPGGRDT
jgi:hypothetical protein